MFATFDLKTNVFKKQLVIKAFGQVLDFEHVISTDTGWFQCEMNILCRLRRFFDQCHFVQHFFTALRTFDRFLTVK